VNEAIITATTRNAETVTQADFETVVKTVVVKAVVVKAVVVKTVVVKTVVVKTVVVKTVVVKTVVVKTLLNAETVSQADFETVQCIIRFLTIPYYASALSSLYY